MHLLIIGELAGLDDDLEGGLCADGFANGCDVLHEVEILLVLEPADVDDHVDLIGTSLDGLGRFRGLAFGGVGSQREADDRADLDVAVGEQGDTEADPARVDADCLEAVFTSLGTELGDFYRCSIGLEDGVIDEEGEIHYGFLLADGVESCRQCMLTDERERVNI